MKKLASRLLLGAARAYPLPVGSVPFRCPLCAALSSRLRLKFASRTFLCAPTKRAVLVGGVPVPAAEARRLRSPFLSFLSTMLVLPAAESRRHLPSRSPTKILASWIFRFAPTMGAELFSFSLMVGVPAAESRRRLHYPTMKTLQVTISFYVATAQKISVPPSSMAFD